jgi:hypothetical protein
VEELLRCTENVLADFDRLRHAIDQKLQMVKERIELEKTILRVMDSLQKGAFDEEMKSVAWESMKAKLIAKRIPLSDLRRIDVELACVNISGMDELSKMLMADTTQHYPPIPFDEPIVSTTTSALKRTRSESSMSSYSAASAARMQAEAETEQNTRPSLPAASEVKLYLDGRERLSIPYEIRKRSKLSSGRHNLVLEGYLDLIAALDVNVIPKQALKTIQMLVNASGNRVQLKDVYMCFYVNPFHVTHSRTMLIHVPTEAYMHNTRSIREWAKDLVQKTEFMM